MKIECELCRELVSVSAFRIAADRIEIDCPSCRGSFAVTPSTESDPVVVRFEAPSGGLECPKCNTVAPGGARACGRCGLLVERFAGYRDPSLDDAPAALIALWAHVDANWQDDRAHDQFVKAAFAQGCFTFAAAKYREVKRKRLAGRADERAGRWLAEIGRRAEATMLRPAEIRRSAAPRKSARHLVVFVLVMVALTLTGVVLALHVRNKQAAQRAARDLGVRTVVADASPGVDGADGSHE